MFQVLGTPRLPAFGAELERGRRCMYAPPDPKSERAPLPGRPKSQKKIVSNAEYADADLIGQARSRQPQGSPYGGPLPSLCLTPTSRFDAQRNSAGHLPRVVGYLGVEGVAR